MQYQTVYNRMILVHLHRQLSQHTSSCKMPIYCDGDGVFDFFMASSEIWQYDIVSFFNSCYLQRISYCFVFVTSHTVGLCIQTTYTLRGAVTFPKSGYGPAC